MQGAGGSKEKRLFRSDLGLLSTFIIAALIMTWLSYSLPQLLPGDFVTATYGASHVTLTADQEAALRAELGQEGGFGHYLWRLSRFDWGYSYVFQNAGVDPFSECTAMDPIAHGNGSYDFHDHRLSWQEWKRPGAATASV